MKHNLKELVLIFGVILLSMASKFSSAQCSLLNGTYIGTIAPTSGTAFVTYPNFGPGYYFLTPVINGGSYALSTCGALIDSQISVWGGFNTNLLLYNDDNGAFCSGSNASGNFVANLTNYAYMFISEYNCLPGGSASINVYYRQNDNLAFTSSSASMCPGQSRTLTATPAGVGSVPNVTFGDPGTFSGFGVSGNVFTAPIVNVSTNYTITYTFGYVSKTQVITVNPTYTLSTNAPISGFCSGSQVTLTASGANSYTWTGGVTNGVAFTPTANAGYTVMASDLAGCQASTTAMVLLNNFPSNQTVSVSQVSVCSGGTVSANLNSSEYGVLYTLINTANNATLTLPKAGNGSSISIGSNTLATSATLGIVAAINPSNGALAFDGVNDYIVASNTISPTQGTWEGWVYKNNWAVHNDDLLFGNAITYSNTNSFYVSLHPGVGLHFRYGSTIDPGNGYASYLGTQNLPANSWHYIAATWKNVSGFVTLNLYLDGVNVGSSFSTATLTPSFPVYIGGSSNALMPIFGPGKMDEIKMWNFDRTQSQINADMTNYPVGATPSLTSYWNFEDGTGSPTALDISGNNITATLTNMNVNTVWDSRPRAGCSSNLTQTIAITVNPTPTLAVNSGSICAGSSFTILPSGAGTYSYSGGSAVVTPTANTSYTVTGTSAQGCPASNTVISNVTINVTPTLSINSGSICSGNSFTILPSGASSYTYSSGSAVVSPTANASYTVTGVSSQGCPASNTVVSSVTVNTTPTISVNSGSICAGNSFTIVPVGAASYTYSGGSAVVSPTSNASYSVTGISAQGCPASNTVVSGVTVNITPTLSVNSGSICSGNSFTILPVGAASYTYSSGSAIVSPTSNTSYTVTGVSAQGCPASNVVVSGVTVNITPTLSANSGTICSGNSFTIVPGGAATYTYSGGSAIVTPTVNSSYSITGTSAQGCPASNTVLTSVVVNTTPIVSVSSGSICSGSSFTLSPIGAVSYTYSGGVAIVAPLINTSYTITGANAFGCTNTAVSNVTVNATPTLSINNGTICSGNSFTILPSGASSYTYSGGSAVVTPTANASYTVTGTSAQGCPASNTVVSNVTVNITPTVSVNSGSICSGKSFTMLPSGANTYSYSSGSAVVSPLTNTGYSVTGTSAQGCVSSNTAVSNVTVYISPTITVNSGSICSGNSFIITPTGASTYTYSGGSATITPISNTTISVTGTSSLGCLSTNTAISSVTVNITPTLSVNSGSICSGNSFTIVPSGALSYTYSGGSAVVNPSVSTSYSVTGISAQGCVASNTAVSNVTVNITPTISAASGAICVGGSYTISPSGGNSYSVTGGSYIVSPSVTTSYSVTGTSSLNCPATNTAVVTVSVQLSLSVSIAGSNTVCNGNALSLTANGAATYTWNTGAINNTIAPTPTANTTYSVLGASGTCSSTAVISVSVLASPTITALASNSAVCLGGTVTLTASGANNYSWSGGVVNGASFTPTATNVYTVVGTNTLNGCNNTTPVTLSVTVNSLPTVSASVTNTLVCSGTSVILTGTGANTYLWTGGALNNISFIPPGTGSYSVTGTNTLTGCTSTNNAVVSVTVISSPTLTVAVSNPVICSGATTAVNAIGADIYTWTGGLNNGTPFTPLVTASYSVSGTSTLTGCTSTNIAVTITVNPLPTLVVLSSNTLLCVGQTASLTASGATNYIWDTGANTAVIAIAPTTTTIYTLTGTDANNCSNKTSYTQNVSDCLGLNNLLGRLSSVIQIYPNPNNGEFVVIATEAIDITIINEVGQIVKRISLNNINDKVHISNFANGIYFVVANSNGQLIKQKLVVEK